MNVSIRSRSLVIATAGMLWLTAQAPPLAAQASTGGLQGTVTDAATRRPLPNAQIGIVGTRYGALTDASGRWRIPNVPVGAVHVTVRLIGYAPTGQNAQVAGGQTATVDFALNQQALNLSEVVVTGTGGVAVEAKTLGNTVAAVNTADLQTAPIQSPTEVLQGRVPGVAALPSGGLTGEGARIRIRGNASLSQSNEAIVYIDGIRADNGGGFGGGTGLVAVGTGGGGNPSRLDDIDPEAIERVEILKGAAAATLYGTEASNGVIQMFTKRGEAGPPRWNFRAEQSFLQMPDRFHPNAGFARTPEQAEKLSAFYGRDLQPFEVFTTKFPLQLRETGTNTTFSGSVSGGTQQITYYVAGRYFTEDGPFSADDAGRNAIQKPLAADENRLYQATASVSIFPRDNLRLAVRALYADRHQDAPGNNNYIYAPFTLAQFGKPERSNCDASMTSDDDPTLGIARPGRCSGPGNQMGAGAFATVREGLQERIYQDATHFNGVLSAAWIPIPELTLDATFGIDNTAAKSVDFLPFGNAVDQFSAADPEGYRAIDNTTVQNITLDSKATWARDIGESISSTFVFGGQGFITRRTISAASSHVFPGPGLEVVGAGIDYLADERLVKVVNAGVFAQEQVGWNDWLFATVGARYDKNSAFGENTAGQFYPKASVSAVLSDRPGWNSSLLSQLRLRAAIGKSGRQPGAFDKLTTYEALPSEFGGGLVPSNLGNPDLKPEVSTEIEAGTELGFFENRVGVQVTYWDRVVKDALVNKQFPLTGGFISRQIANIGELTAHGFELGINGYVMNRENVSLDLFANGAYIKQKVTSLGGAAPLKVGGSYPRYRNFLIEGQPPGALLGAKLMAPCSSYGGTPAGGCLSSGQLPYDLDKNGTPDTFDEMVAFFSDPANAANFNLDYLGGTSVMLRADDDGDGDFLDHYLGKSTPDWQGGFGGNLRFLRNFRLGTLFEYKAGNYTVTNLTDAFRNSNAVIGRNTPDAARVEATILNPATSAEDKAAAAREYLKLRALSPYDGLNQNSDGSFVRWRELSLTYNASPRFAGMLRARDAAITFGVRNLALWTKYNGTDPEINAVGRGTGEGGVDEDFLDAVDAFGFPLTRRFTLSVRLGY
jgi:TonB-linked SusC/RagA family outer membrane protein